MKRNKYEQTVDEILDLHRLTSQAAEEAVLEFLNMGRTKGFTRCLIITGKGNHSQGMPVLKKRVTELLIQENYSFRDAKIQEGGSGAIVVTF